MWNQARACILYKTMKTMLVFMVELYGPNEYQLPSVCSDDISTVIYW